MICRSIYTQFCLPLSHTPHPPSGVRNASTPPPQSCVVIEYHVHFFFFSSVCTLALSPPSRSALSIYYSAQLQSEARGVGSGAVGWSRREAGRSGAIFSLSSCSIDSVAEVELERERQHLFPCLCFSFSPTGDFVR